MKRKYSQYFAIEARMKKDGFTGSRKDLVKTFTENRKVGLSELSEVEYRFFLHWLKKTFPEKITEPATQEDDPAQLMRMKMIALFRSMGYNEGANADMERIYAWVVKYGYLKKRLMEYTETELPRLVTQVERYYKSTLL